MQILVTGGAGYIGSAAVKKLIEEGHAVVVVDNLSKGLKQLVDAKAIFYEGDVTDNRFVDEIFSNHKFDAVMHFAGYKAVGESMKDPTKYSQNMIGTITLLNAMVKHNVMKIIFSSSAAVYGEPQYVPVDEEHPTNPTSYYGFTKLECERIIEWYGKTRGIIGICLRYFNVVGDAGLNYVDPAPENILPIIQEVLNGKREKLIVFGKDYPTRDGTCVRDYVDINDLVRAHVLALGLEKSEIINLGTSCGVTVLELIRKIETETGKQIPFVFGPRREGDPAVVIASCEKAKKLLGVSS
jgi:UDP-glucose 4-epimerase